MSPVYPSGAGVPPRNGPAPFFMVAEQGQHTPGQPTNIQQQYPPLDAGRRTASGQHGRLPAPTNAASPPPSNPEYPTVTVQQSGHRPSSTYGNPQELATSAFSSPTIQQKPQSDYIGSQPYPDEDPYGAGPASQSQPSQPPPTQYNAFHPGPGGPAPSAPPGQGGGPGQPSYEPPAVPGPLQIHKPQQRPGSAGRPGSASGPDARNTLPSQSAQGGQGYKPYQRPGSSDGRASAQGQGSVGGVGGGQNPADFYRNAY